jgi:peptidyl-prolyl cis-trans isomerase C
LKRIVLSSSLAVVFGLGLATTPACKKPNETPAQTDGESATAATPKATGPVAKVNGTEIGRAEFEKQMERTRSRFQRAGRQIAPALDTRLRENLVRKLVEEELIGQKAKSEKVVVETAELDAKLAEHKGRFGSDKAFQSFLERTSQSEADVKVDLEKNLLRDKLFAKLLSGAEPTDVDAQKYYEENKDKYKQKEQIKASHILFKTDKNTPEPEKKKKEADAKKVAVEAKKKGVNFEELAKKHSEGPTAQRGGDLGAFSRGRMVKQFEDVAFAANPGDVVGPVETQFGWHIIKIYEKTPEVQRPYAEVKDSILTSLKARQKSKATRDLLDKLRTDAKIEVLEAGVSLDAKRPLTAEGNPLQVPNMPPVPGAAGAMPNQLLKTAEGSEGGAKDAAHEAAKAAETP